MPFRLDEIPFFNTSMMCEPADLTCFTSFEEEHEPWDAPLRRRNNVSSHISSKLYQNSRRESYDIVGSDEGVLIMEPFSRDPTMPLKRIQPRKYSSPRPSVSHHHLEDSHSAITSPTPYSTPNISSLASKFADLNGKADSKVFKKRAPAPPQDFSYRAKTPPKKGPAPQPIMKADPLLKEMQSFGNKVKNL